MPEILPTPFSGGPGKADDDPGIFILQVPYPRGVPHIGRRPEFLEFSSGGNQELAVEWAYFGVARAVDQRQREFRGHWLNRQLPRWFRYGLRHTQPTVYLPTA